MLSKKILVFLLIPIGLLLLGIMWVVQAPIKPQISESKPTGIDSPVSTVESLHRYHQNKDRLTDVELKEVFSLFTDPESEEEKRAYDFYYSPQDEYTRLWRAVTAGALEVLKSYKILGSKINDARATVEVYREILSRSQTDEPDEEWTQTITISLEKQGEKWLIEKCGERKYACFLGVE